MKQTGAIHFLESSLKPSCEMKVMLIAIVLTIIAVATTAQSYPDEGKRYGAVPLPNAAAYPQPVYNYLSVPRPYSFGYEINDPQSYNDYGHHESSDGKTVTGSYRVALPDGRLQLVSYKADEYGYVADVQYQGEAKYPEYRSQQYSGPAGPGPIATPVLVRGPIPLSGPGYASRGPARTGLISSNAVAGSQVY